MRRLVDNFYRLLMALSALSMVAAFVAVMLSVADREFALGLRGLDAYAGYAIAAALFLALPGTFQRGEHIRVTLLLQAVPERIRAVLEWWCLVAGMVLSGALAAYAVKLVWVSYVTHDVSTSSDATPLWIPQIAMALGCMGLAVAFADAITARATTKSFFREAPAGEAAHME